MSARGNGAGRLTFSMSEIKAKKSAYTCPGCGFEAMFRSENLHCVRCGIELPITTEDDRKIVYGLLSLPNIKILQIGLDLDFISSEDKGKTDEELYGLIIKRAREKSQMHRLAAEVRLQANA